MNEPRDVPQGLCPEDVMTSSGKLHVGYIMYKCT